MSQAISRAKNKEIELPCERYGDHVATNAMVVVFLIAITAGAMYTLTGIEQFFKISILAQGGSFITFQIYKFKQRD